MQGTWSNAWRLTLTAAVALAAGACAPPDGGPGEEAGSLAQALCPAGQVCSPPPTPTPAPPPGSSVTLSQDDLVTYLGNALRLAEISIDSTGSAPPRYYPTSVTNPVWAQCQRDLAACNLEPFAARAACRADVRESCAGVPTSITTMVAAYSYVTFSDLAKSKGAKDRFFSIGTIQVDGFSAKINYINTYVTNNLAMGFSTPLSATQPSVWLYLTGITSNSPTIDIDNFPDITLFGMNAGVSLDGLRPSADGQRIEFASANGFFGFSSWDANNVPDFLVGDMGGTVRTTASGMVSSAFGDASVRGAISQVLTEMFAAKVVSVHPAGYSQINGVVGDGASIRVYYYSK